MNDYLLTTNQISSRVRHETLDSREFLVAPVVAIVAGVLNNELVTVEEIGRYVDAWNGRPVPLAHPSKRGTPISANSPDIEASQVIGRFWNAEMAGDRLRGEIWIDVEKAQRLGGDALEALQRLERGDGIEVSTAFFRDLEEKPGQLNGQKYHGVAHNLRPDHLALLLHQIGACSWKDGCGVPRINSEGSLQINQHTGVMVALFPSAEIAARLALSAEALPEGSTLTPAAEMHLTLGYLGDLEKDEVRIEQGQMMEWVMNFARNSVVVRGQLNGIGRFFGSEGDGTEALVGLYDCEYLNAFRSWLVDALPIKRNHGFTPHITLAYLPAGAPMPDVRIEPMEIVFDRIGVAWAGQVTLFELQGEVLGVQANEASNGSGFNPITLARKALSSLANVLGFKTGSAEAEPSADAPVINSAPDRGKENGMEKKDLVEKLVANQSHPFDRADLEAMSETALQKLATAVEGGCGGGQQTPQVNAAVTAELVVPEEMKQLGEEVKNLSAALQELGGVDGLKAALTAVQANASQRKSDLVAELKTNERCAFGEEDLQAMSVDQLEKLAASLRPANYAGRGGPRGNSSTGAQSTVPEPPKVVMAEPVQN